MKYGIPYMGSKRKHAKEIVDYILKENKNMKYFYDLFGGGGAISFEMLKHKNIKVIYNEHDPAIVNLIKKIRDDGVTDEFFKWISRDEFFKYKDGTDWFSGMVKTCWSFGNNYEKGYMFGKKIEPLKKLLHYVVVDKCQESATKFNKHFGTDIQVKDIKGETANERRLNLQRFLTRTVKNREIFKGFCGYNKSIYSILQQLRRLEQLERLEQLQQLEQLEQLEIHNLSYEQVPILTPIEETIIYCDPPYQNTGKYRADINHEKFFNWVRNHKYKIYISEYKAPFAEVWRKNTVTIFSASSNNTKRVERLFCNKYNRKKDN